VDGLTPLFVWDADDGDVADGPVLAERALSTSLV